MGQGFFTMFSLGAAGYQDPNLKYEEIDGVKKPANIVFSELIGKKVVELHNSIKTLANVTLTLKSKEIVTPSGIKTLVQTLIIDDTIIATIPGEVVSIIGKKFRNQAGYRNNIIISVANDYLGYLVPEDMAMEGITYESKGSTYRPLLGKTILDEVLALARQDYIPGPKLDLRQDLGGIRGRVLNYNGSDMLHVGVMNKIECPSNEEKFQGKTVLAGSEGDFELDSLRPGKKYFYVRELGITAGKISKVLIYGVEATVVAGKFLTLDIDLAIEAKRKR